MSDVEQLLLVLVGLTLAFAAVWVRPAGLLLVSRFGEPFRIRAMHRHAILANDRGGLLLGGILPTGSAVAASTWPLCASPEGVLAVAPFLPGADSRPLETAAFVPFAELKSATAEGRTVLVNGRPFVGVPSKAAAVRWAKWLVEIRDLKPDARAKRIERDLAGHCDAKAAVEAFARCRQETGMVRRLSLLLFAFCFLALGLAVFTSAVVPLREAFAGYFVLSLATALAYGHAAKKLGVPGGHAWMLPVSPADGFRAADHLGRAVLEPFHPLALAHALSNAATTAEFAREVARDLAHPLPTAQVVDPKAAAVIEWFAPRYRAAIESLIRNVSADAVDGLAAPVREDPGAVAYCPRCHCQFAAAVVPCPACGTPSVPFA